MLLTTYSIMYIPFMAIGLHLLELEHRQGVRWTDRQRDGQTVRIPKNFSAMSESVDNLRKFSMIGM